MMSDFERLPCSFFAFLNVKSFLKAMKLTPLECSILIVLVFDFLGTSESSLEEDEEEDDDEERFLGFFFDFFLSTLGANFFLFEIDLDILRREVDLDFL